RPLADHLAIAIENINLNRKNHELLSQAERRGRLLRAANDVGKKVTSVLDLKELMPMMVNTIVEEYGFYYAGVFLLDESSEYATLRAGYGEAGKAMLAKGHRLQVGGNSMIGDCIRLNEARIAPDVDEESIHFRNPFLPNTRSEMALPLSFGRKVLAAVTIQSVEEHAFSESDISTLRIMADHLAVAIQNAYTMEILKTVSAELLRNKVYEALTVATTEAIHWIGNKALPISMTVQRLKKNLDENKLDTESLREDLVMIGGSSKQIIHAREQLIGPARERKPRPVLLADIIQAAAHQHGIESSRLKIKIALSAAYVIADSTQFTRILGGLFLNAMEAGATKIKIQADMADEKDYVQISIIDDGNGITREVLNKAWTPFFTTKRDHDGLGLPAALHVVSQLQGNIHLKSKPGKGATVDILLPIAHPIMTLTDLNNIPHSILLIDDDDAWAKYLANHLGKFITRRADANINPQADLIIVDEHIEAIPFASVIDAAKQAGVISKTIVVTAALDVDRITRILRSGVRDVCLKPYGADELPNLWNRS
ncbi:MAG: GAF domain-containing protein, partial [Anaerolineales bacterium]|nr:GAF domain-containing protein [Anaerolineales bacterium]